MDAVRAHNVLLIDVAGVLQREQPPFLLSVNADRRCVGIGHEESQLDHCEAGDLPRKAGHALREVLDQDALNCLEECPLVEEKQLVAAGD